MSKTMTPWKCLKCGAILGHVVRNGSGVRELLLYREAVDPAAVAPADAEGADCAGLSSTGKTGNGASEVDIIAVVHDGTARCSICEAVRPWVPGDEALRSLLARRKAWKIGKMKVQG